MYAWTLPSRIKLYTFGNKYDVRELKDTVLCQISSCLENFESCFRADSDYSNARIKDWITADATALVFNTTSAGSPLRRMFVYTFCVLNTVHERSPQFLVSYPKELLAEVMAQRAKASLEAQGHTGAKKRVLDEQRAGHEQGKKKQTLC
jgi:hypothetical protein